MDLLPTSLSMTEVEPGTGVANAVRHDAGEIVSRALERASKILLGHPLAAEIGPDLPTLKVDAVFAEQRRSHRAALAANRGGRPGAVFGIELPATSVEKGSASA